METAAATTHSAEQVARTNIVGLDQILTGGFNRNRLYLVGGLPGSGKTTLAMQFLLAGRDEGESCLYVTLSETRDELLAVARSHGWSLDGIDIVEVLPTQEQASAEQHYTLFHPAEVELGETAGLILKEVERTKPTRVVFDSLSELRLLAGSPLHYRRQVLTLKQFFAGRSCTVVVLDDLANDYQVQSLVHGVLELEQIAVEYGSQRRRLRVVKYRGVGYFGGYHDFTIRRGGLRVFPRLNALPSSRRTAVHALLPTGLPGLDEMIGGGILRGSSVLLVGPAGSGKSSIAAAVAVAAAERGERAALFIFDESEEVLFRRTAGLGIDVERHVREGNICVEYVSVAELSPGEFASRVATVADRDGMTVVVIDSLSGYLNAMPNEKFLVIQLRELLTYLGRRGLATLLIAVQHGLIGANMKSPTDTSYLSDMVILLRFFEAFGVERQALSVMKMRGGYHARTIHEFKMRPGSMEVGRPLTEFRGILTGVPEYIGTAEPLLEE